MKNILLIIGLNFLMLSCSTVKFTKTATMVDFREYLKEGFFVTQSNSISFNYESIGFIEATIYSGFDKSMGEKRKYKREFESSYSEGTWHNATIEEAMKLLVEKCKTEGANGVLNLNFKLISDPRTGNVIMAYASGMAITKK